MTDVALNRETCYHCSRPIRWKRSDEVCRECHDKWGEPKEVEWDKDGSDGGNDEDESDGVVRTIETISCPNCPGWNLLKAKDNGYFCRNCHEEFTESEVDT